VSTTNAALRVRCKWGRAGKVTSVTCKHVIYDVNATLAKRITRDWLIANIDMSDPVKPFEHK
jgi:hypothetical protein